MLDKNERNKNTNYNIKNIQLKICYFRSPFPFSKKKKKKTYR